MSNITPIYTPLVADGSNGLVFSTAPSANYGRYATPAPVNITGGSYTIIPCTNVVHSNPFVLPDPPRFRNNYAGTYDLFFSGNVSFSDTTTIFDVAFDVNGTVISTIRLGIPAAAGSYGFSINVPGHALPTVNTPFQVQARRVGGAGTCSIVGDLWITYR